MADGDGLTQKELLNEVRGDVKAILATLAVKANVIDLEKLVDRVEKLETQRVAALELRLASKDAVDSYRKWIVGLGATAILTLLGLIGSVALRFLHIGK